MGGFVWQSSIGKIIRVYKRWPLTRFKKIKSFTKSMFVVYEMLQQRFNWNLES